MRNSLNSICQKSNMGTLNEKYMMDVAEASASIKQLKLDVEQNAVTLTQYEKALYDQSPPSSQWNHRHQLQKILQFIAHAPLEILRTLNRRLQTQARRILQRLQQSSWPLPRILVGDVIRFEDALGRRCNLPFEYFKHWTLFQPYLIHIFKDLPGDYQVRRGRYRLTAARNKSVLGKETWRQQVQPGDRISMSIVAISPFDKQRTIPCPSCGTTPAGHDPVFGEVTCTRCVMVYLVSTAISRCHVTPSDGYFDERSLLVQKRSFNLTKFLSNKIYAHSNDQQEKGKIDGTMIDLNETTHGNVGISKLKKVLLHSTHDPAEIANSIEDLLDQMLTASNDPRLAADNATKRLRSALALIRDEAGRKDKLNYFDFESEHQEFMRVSLGVTKYLEYRRDTFKYNSGVFLSHAQNAMTSFLHWVCGHYPLGLDFAVDGNLPENTLVLVKTLTGKLLGCRLPLSLTVRQLKEMVRAREGNPVDQQYLVYKGRKLHNELTIGHYDIGPTYYVHILLPIWYVAKATDSTEDEYRGKRPEEHLVRAVGSRRRPRC